MDDPRVELLSWIQDLRALIEAERLSGRVDVPAGVDALEILRSAPSVSPPSDGPPPPVSALAPSPPVAPKPRATPPAAPTAEVPPLAPRSPARESLGDVRAALGDCQRCGLCKTRRSIVFGVGDPSADLLVVGEGPGEREDAIGEPFVGPAGEMLDKMLANVVGLRRDQTYIANIVKCRPPGNRNPEPDEVAACLPFLHRQIAAVRPKVILVLGGVAAKNLLQTEVGITKLRGQWVEFRGTPVLPTFHPAYLLRKPEDKRLTFADLKELRARYDALTGRGASG